MHKPLSKKCPQFGVILVHISPHSDWIRRDRLFLHMQSEFGQMQDQNNFEYRYFSRSEQLTSNDLSYKHNFTLSVIR